MGMSQTPPPQTERDQAERWFMRLQMGNCTSADRAACARWRLEDPAHAAAYAEVERVFHLAKRAGEDPRMRAAARVARERMARKHRRGRSEEHTSELQSLIRIAYADFFLINKNIVKRDR